MCRLHFFCRVLFLMLLFFFNLFCGYSCSRTGYLPSAIGRSPSSGAAYPSTRRSTQMGCHIFCQTIQIHFLGLWCAVSCPGFSMSCSTKGNCGVHAPSISRSSNGLLYFIRLVRRLTVITEFATVMHWPWMSDT